MMRGRKAIEASGRAPGKDGITIVDPDRAVESAAKGFEKIHGRAI
jgi:hypothetical protein